MPFLDNDGVTRLTTDYLDVFARKEDAILDPSGGLIRTDNGISVDSLTRESDGAISGSITELTAEGHAEQFSTTGKNLLQLKDGTYTLVSDVIAVVTDDRITVNGTNSSGGGRLVHLSVDIELAAGTYTFGISNLPSNINAFIQDNSNNILARTDQSIMTFTLASTTTVYFGFNVVANVTYTNAIVSGIQLEAGSTATEYEPYTGGAPSPSPDYPQEIQVVRGRNLLQMLPQTRNGLTWTVQDGKLYYSGTASSAVCYYYPHNATGNANKLSLKAGTYTIKISSSAAQIVYCAIQDGSSYIVSNSRQSTFTLNSDTDVIIFAQITGLTVGTSYSGYVEFQLTLGSVAHPYVPYGHVGMEVQTKNLVPMMQSETISGITATVADDGTITLNGTATATAFFYCQCNIAPGTYTLSTNNPIATSAGTVVFKLVDAATADIPGGSKQINDAYTVVGITIQAMASNYVIRIAGGSTLINYTMRLQLEHGSTATEYEPYYYTTTPIPLPQRGWVAGLPDGTADTLTLDGAGKVTWELDTNEVVFDGSNLPNFMASNSIAAKSVVDKLNTGTTTLLNFMSDHFIPGYTVGRIYSYYANIYMYMPAVITSQAECDAFFTTNPVTVLYPLAAPITEDCGYVDLPDIPSDATVTIPELDALGVKYFVDDSAGTLARQWYERADDASDSSIDQRIELVESNIATIESTTAQSNHAVNSYFMLDNVLRKATSAIASGETISNSNSSPITVEQVVTALNNSVAALEKEVVFATTPSVSHRNIYRGKNLGTALTTAQKAQIAAGTFDDLYVGDYWIINGRVYRIADIDYYYNVGNTAFTKHHLVIVPDASFGNSAMNDTNTTEGAYIGSKIYTSSDSVLNTARTTISNDFGNSLASHREYLPNAIDSSGAQSAGAWYDSTVELMNEPMVYGCFIHAKPMSGTGYLDIIVKAQLALFRLNPAIISLRYSYWLRDVVSSSNFAYVYSSGVAAASGASNTDRGVRPFFIIVGN